MNATQAPAVSRRERLLQALADGEFHSGETLARQLQVTRAAIWKLIGALRELGIAIESQPRQGYRLSHAVQLYDAQHIASHLNLSDAAKLQRIDVLLMVDSTNRHLTEHPATVAGQAVLCVAEIQQAGRGRRGRSWMAPFGSGICMSLGLGFDTIPAGFSALSLVVGVALTRALHQLGATEVGLKWPNDVMWRGRKLGGVLTEMRGEQQGPAHVVIGIGCNLRMPAATRLHLIETQAALLADLHEILGEQLPDRNVLVAAFTTELLQCLQRFSHEGFAAFIDEWQRYDALRDAAVKIISGEQLVLGLARGVAEDGSLLLETSAGIQRFMSAEVSLRASVTR